MDDRPQLEGQKSREVAAEKAGFTSEIQHRRTKRVVQKGVPELVDAMDKKELSIGRAAEIAKLPPEEQREALKKPKPEPKPPWPFWKKTIEIL